MRIVNIHGMGGSPMISLIESRTHGRAAHATFFVLVALAFGVATAHADELRFKDQFLDEFVQRIPDVLKTYDESTGKFGKGIWICRDQEAIYPLAVAWAIENPRNPYYHDPKLLEAILAGGDVLIAEQTPKGQWIFRKKDDSTWGDIYMPWTYSRWIRALSLIKDAMPPARRVKWEKALTLGFDGIVAQELKKPVQNIPGHDAMATYLAGKVFNRPDYCEAAKAYMKKVVDAQSPDGFWSEHSGPVVLYGFVYVEEVGLYYAMSHDEYVLPALERAARFHAALTYPDGSRVETIDERNGYEGGIVTPNVGFTFSPVGRGYVQRQLEMKRRAKQELGADWLASYLLYGEEGEAAPPPAQGDGRFITQDRQAETIRQGPWFACLSGYHVDVQQNRWIQDRQNLVSLFHDKAGVIIGGGNTKLQPRWSTFSVGDVKLLSHTPGDENPKFTPPAGFVHVPTDAKLSSDGAGLDLDYGGAKCSVSVDISDLNRAKLIYTLKSTDRSDVAAHVTLLPRLKASWRTASGKHGKLSKDSIELAPGEAGEWFQLGDVRISLPPQASISWPVLPHDQYKKDGAAEAQQGRIVIDLPFKDGVDRYELDVTAP